MTRLDVATLFVGIVVLAFCFGFLVAKDRYECRKAGWALNGKVRTDRHVYRVCR